MSRRYHFRDGRYVYREYEVGSRTVAMIEDARNERAWIQSTATEPVQS